MANKHIIHARSNQLLSGSPKLPTVDRIEYGEIAVNYSKGNETISLKNDNNEIISLPNNKTVNKIISSVGLDSSLEFKPTSVVFSSTTNVSDACDEIVDEIIKNEKVTSEAIIQIKNSSGLDDNLIYNPKQSSNYIKSANTIANAIEILDTKVFEKPNKEDLSSILNGETNVNQTSNDINIELNDIYNEGYGNFIISSATPTKSGVMSSIDKSKLDSIESGATKVSSGTVSSWGYKNTLATSGESGLMSAEDKTQLLNLSGTIKTVAEGIVIGVSGVTSGYVQSQLQILSGSINSVIADSSGIVLSQLSITSGEISSQINDVSGAAHSEIEQTASSITSTVSGVSGILMSQIEQTSGSIISTVSGVSGTLGTQISQKADQVTLEAVSGTLNSKIDVSASGITSMVNSRTLIMNDGNLISNPTSAEGWYCQNDDEAHVLTDGNGLFYCKEYENQDLTTPSISFEDGATYYITMGGYKFSCEIYDRQSPSPEIYSSFTGSDCYVFETPDGGIDGYINFVPNENTPKINNHYTVAYPFVTDNQEKKYWFDTLYDYTNSLVEQTASSLTLSVNAVSGAAHSEIQQTASSITSTVSGVSGTLGTQISQKADQVTLEAVSGDLNSKIDVTASGITSMVVSKTLVLNTENLIQNPTTAEGWICFSESSHEVKNNGEGLFYCVSSSPDLLAPLMYFETSTTYYITMGGYGFECYIYDINKEIVKELETRDNTIYTYTPSTNFSGYVNFTNVVNTPKIEHNQTVAYPCITKSTAKNHYWTPNIYDYTNSLVEQTASSLTLSVNAVSGAAHSEISQKADQITLETVSGSLDSKIDVTASGITSTVSGVSGTLMSQIEQTSGSIISTVSGVSGNLHTEIQQTTSGITLEIESGLSKTGIDIKQGTIQLTADNTIIDGTLSVNKLNTTGSEASTATINIENGLIQVYGINKNTPNIVFGVNAEGYAVMTYFDNDGNFLYDLGPSGITKQISGEYAKYETETFYKFANSLSDTISSKYLTLTQITYYKWKQGYRKIGDIAEYTAYNSKESAGDTGWTSTSFSNNGKYVSLQASNGIEPTSLVSCASVSNHNPIVDSKTLIGFYKVQIINNGSYLDSPYVIYVKQDSTGYYLTNKTGQEYSYKGKTWVQYFQDTNVS